MASNNIGKLPEFKTPERPLVNRALFDDIRAQDGFSLDNCNQLTCVSRLITYKLQAINPGLSTKDYEEVTQLVNLMTTNGWLSDDDRAWCKEHGIFVN